MQRRILFRAARISANQMQRRHRHVQFGIVGVGQHQVFAIDAARFKGGHSGVAPNSMLKMHYRLADMQLRQVTNQRIGIDGAARVLTTARDALAQQVAFANQRQITLAIDETMLGGANHQIAAITRRLFKTQDMLWRDLNTRQHFAKRLSTPLALDRKNHRPAEGLEESAQVIQRRFVLRLDRQLG